MRSEVIEEARTPSPSSVGELFGQMLDAADADGRLTQSRRAQVAWSHVNGDVERAHTRGVYVAPARRTGEDPVLCVYVDSRARAVDFRANREVYLARLAAAGLRFSDLRVEQSRYAAAPDPAPRTRDMSDASDAPGPRPLTPDERASVDEALARLPQGLRDQAARAVAASEGTSAPKP